MPIYRQAKSTPPPPGPDLWERAKTVSGLIAAVVLPVVVLVVGNLYTSAVKERELEGKFVELAVSILRETPDKQAANLRDWATQVITLYSRVPLSPETRRELIETTPLPSGLISLHPFKPQRVIALGDQSSVIAADGRKYTINALNKDGSIDCAANPIWVQAVAESFGYVFRECNPRKRADIRAFIRATPGAKVDDVRSQIDLQMTSPRGGGINSQDLITLLAGTNDVLEVYSQYPQRSETDLLAELNVRGDRLAAQVNRLVSLGARVVVSTVPDMGATPYAAQQKASFGDTDRAALLSRLTGAFNARLRTSIVNDGRFVGLVLADEMVQSQVKMPSTFGLTNVRGPACLVGPPDCTSKTLAAGATAARWLWADATNMSAAGHSRLGALAVGRVVGTAF